MCESEPVAMFECGWCWIGTGVKTMTELTSVSGSTVYALYIRIVVSHAGYIPIEVKACEWKPTNNGHQTVYFVNTEIATFEIDRGKIRPENFVHVIARKGICNYLAELWPSSLIFTPSGGVTCPSMLVLQGPGRERDHLLHCARYSTAFFGDRPCAVFME